MKNIICKEQDDLLVMPYVDEAKLPNIIRDLMPLASTPAQKDMLLMSILTAAGAAMDNTYFTYGKTRKVYYPNLICFIEAMAAQGKSVAGVGQKLLEAIDEEEPIFLAGDSTHAAFVQHLAEQAGVGFCYESEGSVITDIWKRSGCHGYNSLLRKAAEHEEYRLMRKMQPDIVIDNPKLSMVITGTFDQFRMLVPNAENGLFSRILPLVVRENVGYDPRMALTILPSNETDGTEGIIAYYANELKVLRMKLREMKQPIRFALREEQAKRLGETFYADSMALMPKLGANFHQSIARMTVHTLKIAHILSVLSEPIEAIEPMLYCKDDVFEVAMLIGRKLLLHAADAYMQIEADKKETMPAARGSFQQMTFLSELPEEFSREECLKVAEKNGVAQRSAERWLNDWVQAGNLQKIARGYYRKAA